MIEMTDTDVFLVQFTGTDHEVLHGPFWDEALAWHYLFGREPSEEELDVHKNARWSVRRVTEEADGGEAK